MKCFSCNPFKTLTSLAGSLRIETYFLSSSTFPLEIGLNERHWPDRVEILAEFLPACLNTASCYENTHIPLPLHPLEMTCFLLLEAKSALKVSNMNEEKLQWPSHCGWSEIAPNCPYSLKFVSGLQRWSGEVTIVLCSGNCPRLQSSQGGWPKVNWLLGFVIIICLLGESISSFYYILFKVMRRKDGLCLLLLWNPLLLPLSSFTSSACKRQGLFILKN